VGAAQSASCRQGVTQKSYPPGQIAPLGQSELREQLVGVTPRWWLIDAQPAPPNSGSHSSSAISL
jgi:hypothetical protein